MDNLAKLKNLIYIVGPIYIHHKNGYIRAMFLYKVYKSFFICVNKFYKISLYIDEIDFIENNDIFMKDGY